MTKRKHSLKVQAEQRLLGLSPPGPPIDLTLDSLTLAEQRYLSGPITPALARYRTQCGASVQPRRNGWDFPVRLRAIVPAARWLQMIRSRACSNEEGLASEEEALGYTCTAPNAVRCKCLSCASLEAPLSLDWVEIFVYLGQQVFLRWEMISGESVQHVPGCDQPITLNDQQLEDLHRFRRWLRHQVEEGAQRSAGQRAKRTHPISLND